MRIAHVILAAAGLLLFMGCAQGLGRVGGDGQVDDGGQTRKEAGPDPAACGNGQVDPGEVCDDGNTADGDDCRSDCLQDLTLCGNGSVDAGESCDDGNTADGDGCSAACQSESCDPQTCPSGCCNGIGVCAPGGQDTDCGSGGQSCQDCTASGMICSGQQCQVPGNCTPGDTQACGNCGTRTCDAGGQWGPCANEGPCAPSQVENGTSCGNCGLQERICAANCVWGNWTCTGEGVCAPGQIGHGSSCGNCGEQERTCTAQCTWGSWTCVGEGVCSPGQTQNQTCGNCGTKTKTCNSSCDWSTWGTCSNQGCSPGSWQDCQECGHQQCNSSCQWGSCQKKQDYCMPSWRICNSNGHCNSVACWDGVCSVGEDCHNCSADCGSCGSGGFQCGADGRNNMCHWPPSSLGLLMTHPFGYCDPNGDANYDDGWANGGGDYGWCEFCLNRCPGDPDC